MPRDAGRSSVSAEMFREVLGQYPTGVAAITALDLEGQPAAMVVGTFTSVSLDPPLVGFMPSRTSRSYARLRTADILCANVLSVDQQNVCRQLARPGARDEFVGIGWTLSPGGAPIIDAATAWVEFEVEQTIEAGDHDIVIGRITELGLGTGGLPLLFLGGGYGRYTAHSRMMPSRADSLQLIRWAELVKPRFEELSSDLGLEPVLVSIIDDTVVQVATYGDSPGSNRPHPLGTRLPLGAPMAAVMIASAGEESRRKWLEHTLPGISEMQLREHFRALDRVRERGWSMNLTSSGFVATDRQLRRLEDGRYIWGSIPLDQTMLRPEAYAAELPSRADDTLGIRNLSSPVRDGHGLPLFYVTLFGFGESTTSADASAILQRLLRATADAEDLVASDET